MRHLTLERRLFEGGELEKHAAIGYKEGDNCSSFLNIAGFALIPYHDYLESDFLRSSFSVTTH